MQNFFLGLIIVINLSIQNADLRVQNNVEPKVVSEQIPLFASKLIENECDYSMYAPVRIQHFDSKAVIKKIQPNYPAEAVRQNAQGKITVKVLINKNGGVEKACAMGNEHSLRSSAEAAALRWKFKSNYGLAFSRPKTKKNPKNFAEAVIVFDFRIDSTVPKVIIES